MSGGGRLTPLEELRFSRLNAVCQVRCGFFVNLECGPPGDCLVPYRIALANRAGEIAALTGRITKVSLPSQPLAVVSASDNTALSLYSPPILGGLGEGETLLTRTGKQRTYCMVARRGAGTVRALTGEVEETAAGSDADTGRRTWSSVRGNSGAGILASFLGHPNYAQVLQQNGPHNDGRPVDPHQLGLPYA